MLRISVRRALKHIPSSSAKAGGSAASLAEAYLKNNAARLAANVPASQRYFFIPKHKNCHGDAQLSPQHTAAQLRLGDAQLLTSTQGHITNLNNAHPLFFAQTSPRQAGLCVSLVMALKRLNIRRLTELQGAFIPLLLKGTHIIAHAETGSGKSFGIALAVANRLMRNNLNYRLHTVVLVPTEELALQYHKWFVHFGGCSAQVAQVAIDSLPLEAQLAKLHNIQPHVLVGTPQRIADITRLSPKVIGEKLRRKVDCLVLDEADVILGTEVRYGGHHRIDGTQLVDRIFRCKRDEVPAQLVAASATVDGNTAQTLNTWTRNDRAVRLTTSFVEHTIPPTIRFYFFAASRTCSLERALHAVLRLICRQERRPRVLLFTAAEDVAPLVEHLNAEQRAAVPEADAYLAGGRSARTFAAALHSLPQTAEAEGATRRAPSSSVLAVRPRQIIPQRGDVYVRNNSTMSSMNEGNLLIGVASHGTSRGLHLNGITHVILYGACPPTNTLVHCVGRTGRMGRSGDAIVIYPPSSGRAVQEACSALEIPYVAGRITQVEQLLAKEHFATSDTIAAVEEANVRMQEDQQRQQVAYAMADGDPLAERP